jgi:outer membrane protein, multidrug efflux system
MFLRYFTLTLITGFIFCLSACRPYHPEPVSSLTGLVPENFSKVTTDEEPVSKWWETFKDPELNALIENAFSDNFNLKVLQARVQQARALADIAGADLYPELAATAGTVYSRRQNGTGSLRERTLREYNLGITGFYDLDVWGKYFSEKQTAVHFAQAGEQDFGAAAIILAAEISTRWIQIISQRMQLRLLNEQLQNNETILELIKLRFRQAMVSALDIYQQQQVIESLQAQIPLVQATESRLGNELAILTGKAPNGSIEILRYDLPDLDPMPPSGIPADLLENRPDIRAAQFRLQSAGWNLAAARANRLPNISFSAGGGFSSRHLDLLLDNWVISLTSNLVAPIFDGNRRAADVERSKAFEDENLAIYKQTVLTAIREVEDALVTENAQIEHIERLNQVIKTARKALEQASIRYRHGLNDYLPVLTQILTVQDLERNMIDQHTILLANRIDLFRALGATWTSELISSDIKFRSDNRLNFEKPDRLIEP